MSTAVLDQIFIYSNHNKIILSAAAQKLSNDWWSTKYSWGLIFNQLLMIKWLFHALDSNTSQMKVIKENRMRLKAGLGYCNDKLMYGKQTNVEKTRFCCTATGSAAGGLPIMNFSFLTSRTILVYMYHN